MSKASEIKARETLWAAFEQQRGLIRFVFGLSLFVNLLGLTGPLFMLQIYDRVLASRSEETLLALTVLVTFLFICLGGLEYARTLILARKGANLQTALQPHVFSQLGSKPDTKSDPVGAMDKIARFSASSAAPAVFDLPWSPLFFVLIALFHPALGILACVGGLALVLVAAIAHLSTSGITADLQTSETTTRHLSEQVEKGGSFVSALGLKENLSDQWLGARALETKLRLGHGDRVAGFAVLSRTMRLYLQSAMLALGAYLVLQGSLTAGAMIAASILLGRAMAPIETVISQWPSIQLAWAGRRELIKTLADQAETAGTLPLPRPTANLVVNAATAMAEIGNTPVLRRVSLELSPGKCLGVVGPSGSGKSSLARAITGTLPLMSGEIRLDAAALQQYGPHVLAGHIGYLPQRVPVFDGTVAENIARMSRSPNGDEVVRAARRAGAHKMILGLPEGYQTRLSNTGAGLSGGQIQLIGLARALYSDPVILLLDEPDANLDAEGIQSVLTAIRDHTSSGGGVILISHRAGTLNACDELLRMDGGSSLPQCTKEELLGALRPVPSNAGEQAKKGRA